MRDNPFEGDIYNTYKPICFKHNGFDVEIKIIPGWEYQIEFNAEKNGHWFFYVLYNIDNGFNTKKKLREKINNLLTWLKEENCNHIYSQAEQLQFDF